MTELKHIDWNRASELGLIRKINTNILHPLGLAMCRDPETGVSPYLLVSDDGIFQYADGYREGETSAVVEAYDEAINASNELGFAGMDAASVIRHLADEGAMLRKIIVEFRAEFIYNSWAAQDGWVPWVKNGNSIKQADARRIARTKLKEEGVEC